MSIAGYDQITKFLEERYFLDAFDTLWRLLKKDTGYDFTAEIGAGNAKQRCARLLHEVEKDQWLELFLFCALLGRPQPHGRKVVESAFSPPLSCGLSLCRFLKEAVPETADKIVEDCYLLFRVSDSAMFNWDFPRPPGCQWNCLSAVCSIACVQDSTSPACIGDSILRRFLVQLRGGLPQEIRLKLDAWWKQACLDLLRIEPGDVPLDVEIASLQAESVMIRLTRSKESADKYLCKAYLVTEGDNYSAVDVEESTATVIPRTSTEVGQFFSLVCKHLQSELDSTVDLLFEFVVEGENVHLDLDSWKLVRKLSKQEVPLGLERPIVIRIDDHPATDKVKRRWKKNSKAALVAGSTPGAITKHVHSVTVRPAKISPTEYDDEHLMCVVISGPLKNIEDVSAWQSPFVAMEAGVPIIVWARSDEAANHLIASLGSALCNSPRDMWRHVWQEVRRKRDCPMQSDLTLIMEQEHFLPSPIKLNAKLIEVR